MLFSEIMLAVVLCGAVYAVVWTLRGLLLTPILRRENADLFCVVRIEGEADGLEQAIRGLMWLHAAGKMEPAVIVAQTGELTTEARQRAERLSEKCGAVFCREDDIHRIFEELRWRDPEKQ